MPPASALAAMAEDAAPAEGSVGAGVEDGEGAAGAPGIGMHTQESLTIKFNQYDEKIREWWTSTGYSGR